MSKEEKRINIITFSEKEEDVKRVAEILEAFRLDYNLITRFDLYENMESASNADGSIVLDESEGGFFAKQLEQQYGVPFIQTDLPVGTLALRKFIHTLKIHFGIRDKEQYELKSLQKVRPYIERCVLNGKRVFLHLNVNKIKSFTSLVQELGGEIAGLAVPYLDDAGKYILQEIDVKRLGVSVTVLEDRPFACYRALHDAKADIYVSETPDFRLVNGIPIPAVYVQSISCIGYQGIYDFNYLVEKALFSKNRVHWSGKYFEPVFRREWILKQDRASVSEKG